eukprot:CAMPEP_0198729348 /NCGR_PEP_ID=MMETSP1475-20131203/17347_1 /TAXON_ID= ORGANISM="Unidentified sp., Strain CCMP1999" /NCGR_SAMPLE_ID=MMETSP1475 /ASSEMBLY_ACC=CAM_ASM_001111 /LENGTH=472 /DNA_ID=CAMNT_0044491963 /DNA_START=44 /DNA_END=1463 /DNA_ORIENTATION=+
MAELTEGADGVTWSEDELNRAVLVRNLPAAASESALEDFFSFCGDVEAQYLFADRQEAIVVFRDTDVQQSALLMNGGKLLDLPVLISAVPDGYTAEGGGEVEADDGEAGRGGSVPVVSSEDILGDVPARSKTMPASASASNNWLTSMKQTLREVQHEYGEVAKEISDEYRLAAREFNDSVKSTFEDVKLADTLARAKSTAAGSASATRARMAEFDTKYDVSHTVSEAAQKSKSQAANISKQLDDKLGVSSAAAKVADVSKGIARDVDENYQLSEKSRQLANKALDNDTIREGIRSISLGWSSFTSRFTSPTQPTAGPAVAAQGAGEGTNGSRARPEENTADVSSAVEKEAATAAAAEGADKGAGDDQAAAPPVEENSEPTRVPVAAPSAEPTGTGNPLEVDDTTSRPVQQGDRPLEPSNLFPLPPDLFPFSPFSTGAWREKTPLQIVPSAGKRGATGKRRPDPPEGERAASL